MGFTLFGLPTVIPSFFCVRTAAQDYLPPVMVLLYMSWTTAVFCSSSSEAFGYITSQNVAPRLQSWKMQNHLMLRGLPYLRPEIWIWKIENTIY